MCDENGGYNYPFHGKFVEKLWLFSELVIVSWPTRLILKYSIIRLGIAHLRFQRLVDENKTGFRNRSRVYQIYTQLCSIDRR